MFCGTMGAIGGIRPSPRFDMELEDPVLGRKLTHGYNVQSLPIVAYVQARPARRATLGFTRSFEDATVKRAIRLLWL